MAPYIVPASRCHQSITISKAPPMHSANSISPLMCQCAHSDQPPPSPSVDPESGYVHHQHNIMQPMMSTTTTNAGLNHPMIYMPMPSAGYPPAPFHLPPHHHLHPAAQHQFVMHTPDLGSLVSPEIIAQHHQQNRSLPTNCQQQHKASLMQSSPFRGHPSCVPHSKVCIHYYVFILFYTLRKQPSEGLLRERDIN